MDNQERNRLNAVYDREAAHYEKNRFADPAGRLLHEISVRKMGALLEEYSPGPLSKMTVGDLGCGTGRLAAPLGLSTGRLVGIDLSLGMLAQARRQDSQPQTSWVRADGFRLPLADGALDALYSTRFFHLFPPSHYPELLQEISRVLAPGGVAILEFNNPDYALGIGWVRDRLIRGKVKGQETSSVIRPGEIERLFSGTPGLDLLEIHGVWKFRLHRTAERMGAEEAYRSHERAGRSPWGKRSMFFYWAIARKS